jgi:hypothetical protein
VREEVGPQAAIGGRLLLADLRHLPGRRPSVTISDVADLDI